jgi:serine/threonine-protein kinase
MGEVFLAWDERLERHVAIKRLRSDRPIEDAARARFHREARAIARLNHSVIVQIYDIIESERGQHLVMEYVEGTRLDRLLVAGGLPLGLVLRLGAELAGGLAQAHAKGILHRDLKAENVIVTHGGHAKLLDFGVAAMLRQRSEGAARGDARSESPGADGSLTESGMLVGTAHAMSPEQARGRALDHRSDLFALGGVLYAMLTGKPPFRALLK